MKCEDLTKDVLQSFVDFDSHQKVVRITDEKTNLKAFIAVHNSNLGPALGGCRMVPYKSEQDAITDVLRLSRGMTYKNALAGLPLGGGKSVIIGDPYKDKTEDMMKVMGSAVESLDGLYVTAEDSGTGENDMELIHTQTQHVVGMHANKGELGGNPSPVTSWGVYCGLKAAVKHRFGKDSVSGLKIAVQGLGAVGYELCRLLYKDGAQLIVTDIRPAVCEQAQKDFPGTKAVGLDDIFAVDADVFAPCALGAQINDKTIPQLKVGVVAGAANNQMAKAADHAALAARGILYVPDYVINAGGVISAGYEYCYRSGHNPYNFTLTRAAMMAHVERIGPTVADILALAEKNGIAPGQAADELAERVFGNPELQAARFAHRA